MLSEGDLGEMLVLGAKILPNWSQGEVGVSLIIIIIFLVFILKSFDFSLVPLHLISFFLMFIVCVLSYFVNKIYIKSLLPI